MKARKAADRETEIKLALRDAVSARRLLREAGFRIARGRVFEANIVFDTPDRRLLAAGSLLRVRRVNGAGILTFKGPAEAGGRHKSRLEIESRIDPMPAAAILEQLGFAPVFYYEKFRTEFTRPLESGAAMLDETPLGVFLELEGGPRWIDRTARSLGFRPADYITKSYARLHLESAAGRGADPNAMRFAKTRGLR